MSSDKKGTATFIVYLHSTTRQLEVLKDMPDYAVQLGGAYVTIEGPENANYGTLQNIAVNYVRKLAEMKPTEVRTVGYAGPV